MKERPILFSGPMVLAILEGRKIMTRRVVKPEGAHHLFPFLDLPGNQTGEWAWCSSSHVVSKHIHCPYGQVGDRMWVRETWRTVKEANDLAPRELNEAHRIWYEASTPHQLGFGKSRPSIYMPRWSSRIALEITGVRVERLQDISEADAIAEGIDSHLCAEFTTKAPSRFEVKPAAVHAYAGLWESINGPGSWEANPFVWCISFRRIDHA